ncbi:MAG TPA: DUF6677 family protein [Longimicrobiales bacterium]|nr:DUF6677 family protein [Longimicrobiales bacterium]
MRGILLLCAALPLIASPLAAGAQQLHLKREEPVLAWAGCPVPASAPEPAAPEARQQAERLVATATEATLLGETADALDRLTAAAGLDPASPDVSYRLARMLESLDQREPAIREYCRYLALPGAQDTADARQRLAGLTQSPAGAVPAAAADAFRTGIATFDQHRFAEAESAFAQARALAPGWDAAVFNHAVTLLVMERTGEAMAQLREYIEMSPGASDFDQVVDALARLRSARPYNPGGALAAGLIVPGLGHFTTGRPTTGALFLAAAGGALAAGLMIERARVECLTTPVDGTCPPDQVRHTDSERPFLLPGIGAAAAIGVIGAIDAWRGARRSNDAAAALLQFGARSEGASLLAPAVGWDRTGAHVALLRLRF